MSPDPEALAALHARCFQSPRPWTAGEFNHWLGDSRTIFVGEATGFALGRVVLDEAELLTIAVAPDARRSGTGRALLAEFERIAQQRGAARCFVDVAANNAAARALYRAEGYAESGRRKGYYRQNNAPAVDAILLGKLLSPP